MVLIYHMVLQDQRAKGSSNLTGGKLFKVSQYPVRFRGHRHCGSRDIIV